MARASTIPQETLSILTQPGTPVVAQLALSFAVVTTEWANRRRTRLALAQLEPWQLRDVGLTPEEASTESRRVCWRK